MTLTRKGLVETLESVNKSIKLAMVLQAEGARAQADAETKLTLATNMLSFLGVYREELQAKLAAMPDEDEKT